MLHAGAFCLGSKLSCCNILSVSLHAPVVFRTSCSTRKKSYDPRCLQHRKYVQAVRQHPKLDENASCKSHSIVGLILALTASHGMMAKAGHEFKRASGNTDV